MSRRRTILALLSAVVVVVGVVVGLHLGSSSPSPVSEPSATPGTSPSPSSSPGTPAPIPGLKPELAGLIDRSGPPPPQFDAVLGGWVVNANWSDLQPTPGGPIAASNVIDDALSRVRELNRQGHGLRLKIRIFAGIHAPEWAKNLGGSPIPVTDPSTGASGTIGRFWSSAFGAAYQELQTKLAARYDAAPEIADVTIARCTTVYSEPFTRDVRDPVSVAGMLAAGYTVALDQQCQRDQVAAHRVWAHTHSSLALNPYQEITPEGRARTDEAFTEQMMDFCRQQLGARCTLENNSIRSFDVYPAMYAAMKQRGGDIVFQTATLAKVGDLQQTISWAIAQGACGIELPAGYERVLVNDAALQQTTTQLSANRST